MRSALSSVLAQDLSVVVPGYSSVKEVEVATKVGNNYSGLTQEETERFSVHLGDHCRDCGECLPCQQHLNVPAILRFGTLAKAYGLRDWAKKLYRGLEVSIDKCTACGECERRCAYRLPIVEMLQRARKELQ